VRPAPGLKTAAGLLLMVQPKPRLHRQGLIKAPDRVDRRRSPLDCRVRRFNLVQKDESARGRRLVMRQPPITYREVEMNPIEELKTEHRAVEASLRILEGLCRKMESQGKITEPAHIDQLLEFFAVFVDTCHHGKEEALLFPALEAQGVSRQGGPIGVMLAEHVSGRNHIKGMRQALADFKGGRQAVFADFIRHARGYADLLRQHIFKEDNVLFQMADQRLPAEVKTQLSEGFERIEREKVGAGKHEAFHRMLDELGKIYG
jgi:hemerythrin-like domain-containing protein